MTIVEKQKIEMWRGKTEHKELDFELQIEVAEANWRLCFKLKLLV
jgi:hypothetical protein